MVVSCFIFLDSLQDPLPQIGLKVVLYHLGEASGETKYFPNMLEKNSVYISTILNKNEV